MADNVSALYPTDAEEERLLNVVLLAVPRQAEGVSRDMEKGTARFPLTEELKHEIVRCVLSVARPSRVIVFGSAATGAMTQDSDVDLLVLEDDGADPLEQARRIRGSLTGLGVAFDVIVMSAKRFEETKDVIGGIAYPARKYGVVIYEAA